jgi:hypothetical protein
MTNERSIIITTKWTGGVSSQEGFHAALEGRHFALSEARSHADRSGSGVMDGDLCTLTTSQVGDSRTYMWQSKSQSMVGSDGWGPFLYRGKNICDQLTPGAKITFGPDGDSGLITQCHDQAKSCGN